MILWYGVRYNAFDWNKTLCNMIKVSAVTIYQYNASFLDKIIIFFQKKSSVHNLHILSFCICLQKNVYIKKSANKIVCFNTVALNSCCTLLLCTSVLCKGKHVRNVSFSFPVQTVLLQWYLQISQRLWELHMEIEDKLPFIWATVKTPCCKITINLSFLCPTPTLKANAWYNNSTQLIRNHQAAPFCIRLAADTLAFIRNSQTSIQDYWMLLIWVPSVLWQYF